MAAESRLESLGLSDAAPADGAVVTIDLDAIADVEPVSSDRAAVVDRKSVV